MIIAMTASIMLSNIFVAEATTGTLSKNTGTRHTIATSLSSKADNYYAGSYAYSVLSQFSGGSSNCLDTVNSDLYKKLHSLMTDTIIKSFSYTSLTTYWPNTDASNNSDNAAMIYSDSASSSSYSREHVWPKSRASFKEKDGGSDIHHLRPENSAINSTRSNYTFGNVRNVLSTYSTKTYEDKDVLYYSPSNDIVEVNDNVKGDIDSVPVSVTDNTVTAESLPLWQISATENGVSLSNGTDFLSYGSTTNFKSSTECYEWNISQKTTDGSFRFTASDSTTRVIAYSISQNKFGAYATSNVSGYVKDLMVFKLKNSGTITDIPEMT